jgi:hypothetical protein
MFGGESVCGACKKLAERVCPAGLEEKEKEEEEDVVCLKIKPDINENDFDADDDDRCIDLPSGM